MKNKNKKSMTSSGRRNTSKFLKIYLKKLVKKLNRDIKIIYRIKLKTKYQSKEKGQWTSNTLQLAKIKEGQELS